MSNCPNYHLSPSFPLPETAINVHTMYYPDQDGPCQTPACCKTPCNKWYYNQNIPVPSPHVPQYQPQRKVCNTCECCPHRKPCNN